MPSPTLRQGAAIAITAVALPALVYIAWPLLTRLPELPSALVELLPQPLADRLPQNPPVGRLLWALVAIALLAAAVSLARPPGREPRRQLGWLILAAWALASLAVVAIALLVWRALGAPDLDPVTGFSARHVDAIATRAFAVIAGMGGVALLVISYRRQRTTENGEQREVAKLFTDTFDSASSKLGEEHAAVRLAGVHALARLADEAPEDREDLVQMVIDVLCAYLRMPYDPPPNRWAGDLDEEDLSEARATGETLLPINAPPQEVKDNRAERLAFSGLREVRHTIIRIIGNRLREETRWQGKDYDFTGVVFDGGDLAGAQFSGGEVSFERAVFSGVRVDFRGARFSGGQVDFSEAEFTSGQVHFSEAEFTSGQVHFSGAVFSGGQVDFTLAQFSGGEVSFERAVFSGVRVDFRGARFSGGQVDFTLAQFSGGQVDFRGAKFSGGQVHFSEAEFTSGQVHFSGAVFSGGQVDFTLAQFSGGQVDFRRAKFSGGQVHFSGADFSGGQVHFPYAQFSDGQVDFHNTGFYGGQVDFEYAEGTCPAGLREARAHAVPEVLLIPLAWKMRQDPQTSHTEPPKPSSPPAATVKAVTDAWKRLMGWIWRRP